eukprot:5617604-Amphidinium_carterae.1
MESESGVASDDGRAGANAVAPLFQLRGPKRKRGRPKKYVVEQLPDSISDRGSNLSGTGGDLQVFHVPLHLHEQGTAAASTTPEETQITVQESSSCLPQVINGYGILPAFVAQIGQACQRGMVSGVALDPQYQKILEWQLAVDYHVCSHVTVEKELQLDRSTLKSKLQRLAAALFYLSMQDKFLLEGRCVASLAVPHKLVACFDFAAHDETPMVTSVKHKVVASSSTPSSFSTGTVIALPPQLALLQSVQQANIEAVTRSRSKLLQVRTGYTMVLAVNVDRAPLYLHVLGTNICPIQVIQKNTGACIWQALNRVSAVSGACHRFPLRVRSVTTDKGAANKVAERAMLSSRQGWLGIHLQCDVHCISACHSKTLESLLPYDVSSMIRTALSVVDGSRMCLFRQALSMEVEKRLVVKRGCCHKDATAYRVGILAVFVGSLKNALVKHLLLNTVANGDWRNPNVIEHWIDEPGPLPKRQDVVCQVQTALLGALGDPPHIYVRHRWTGCAQSIGDLGILLACHSLLLPVYKTFVILVSSSTTHGNDQATATATTTATPHNEEWPSEADMGAMVASETVAEAEDQDPAELMEEAGADKSRIDNMKLRQAASEWLSSHPLHNMMIMKLIVDPLAQLMKDQLYLSSNEFELQERVKMARSMMAGDMNLSSRDFRLTVAAKGLLTNAFFKSIADLWGSPKWELLPETACTVTTRNLVFRMIQRAAAAVFELLVCVHRIYPIRLFLLLHAPAMAADIVLEPSCTKDNFTLQLQEQYPSLLGEEVLHILQAEAIGQAVDIAQIECKHASLRRQLTVRSVQTWRLGLAAVSCDWLFQNHRHGCGLVSKQRSKRGKKHASAGKPSVKQIKGKGGSWRAWIRWCSAGMTGRPDLAALASAYKLAKEKGSHMLQDIRSAGELATVMGQVPGRSRGSAFGQMRTQRFFKQQALNSLWARTSTLSVAERANVIMQHTLSNRGSLGPAISVAKALQRLDGQDRDARELAMFDTLETFQTSIGKQQTETLHGYLKDFKQQTFNAVPSGDLNTFEYCPESMARAQSACAWASCHSRMTNLGPMLEQQWEALHKRIDGDDMDYTQPPPLSQNKCCVAGTCLCSNTGKMLEQMRRRFDGVLKQDFKVATKRKLLLDGHVVVECSTTPDRAGEEAVKTYLAVALMYLSPFRATFHLLKQAKNPEPEVFQPNHDRIYVQLLDTAKCWSVAFYLLDDAPQPLTVVKPDIVPILRLQAHEPKQLWPVPRKPRKQAEPTSVALGWELLLNAGGHEAVPSDAASDETESLASDHQDADYDELVLVEEAQEFLRSKVKRDRKSEHQTELAGLGLDSTTVADELDLVVASQAPAVGSEVLESQVVSASQSKARPVFLGREQATVSMVCAHGRLAFYSNITKFQATCTYHLGCVLTRTSSAAKSATDYSASQGRPLGMMLAWLKAGKDCSSKAEHFNSDVIKDVMSLSRRQECRQELKTMPLGLTLLSHE